MATAHRTARRRPERHPAGVYVGEVGLGGGINVLPAVEGHIAESYTWSAAFSIPKLWHWLTN
jgi:hypothetical protein